MLCRLVKQSIADNIEAKARNMTMCHPSAFLLILQVAPDAVLAPLWYDIPYPSYADLMPKV